jgi:hypothetical protein
LRLAGALRAPALPDSANVFNDVIRPQKEPMADKTVPRSALPGEWPDIRALWRHAAWGGMAALALCAVAITLASQTGGQRLALLLTPAELPVQPVRTVKIDSPKSNGNESLTKKLRELAADRDLLSDRVTRLERQLDEMTGSIKQLAAVPAAAQLAEGKPLSATTRAIAPPVDFPLATFQFGDAATWPAPLSSLEAPQIKAGRSATSAPDATGSIPESAAEARDQATPPSFEKVPLPTARIATAEPGKGEFGLSLAGASSLELTRIQWTMLQANFTKLLAGLEPRALTERRGTATHYRLLAGPLPTMTDAANLCARLIAAHTTCMPVKFAGDPL